MLDPEVISLLGFGWSRRSDVGCGADPAQGAQGAQVVGGSVICDFGIGIYWVGLPRVVGFGGCLGIVFAALRSKPS